MTNITPEHFARICYLVLMQNGDGIMDKSPDYALEKAWMLNDGYEAFGALDIHNMRKVKAWCDLWNVEMPAGPAAYLAESEDAARDLADKGFIF